MNSPEQPIPAHSIAEAYLYLMLVRCANCGTGPLRHTRDLTRTDRGDYALHAKCSSCGRAAELHFVIHPEPSHDPTLSKIINPIPAHSRCIDLLGWLTLVGTIAAAAEEEKNKSSARELTCETARCLDEALKFYDADNDLPPESAFFSADSLRRFRDHPQQFSRSKWRERRLKLPSERALMSETAAARPWWRFWR